LTDANHNDIGLFVDINADVELFTVIRLERCGVFHGLLLILGLSNFKITGQRCL
jgi:hypothetical protein